jgi:hypothetical protein
MKSNFRLGLVAVLAVVSLGGASLVAAQGDLIRACVHNANGHIRIVAAGTACRNNERPLEWSAGGSTQDAGGGLITVTGWTGTAETPALCAAPWNPGFVTCGSPTTRLPIPQAGMLVGLAVAPYRSETGRVTVRVNGVDTALTVEFSGGAVATGEAQVPVQAGDVVEVSGTGTTSTAIQYNATVEYQSAP